MKKLFLLVLLIFSLFAVSCGGEEDAEENFQENDEAVAVSIRTVRDGSGTTAGCMGFIECIYPELSAIRFEITNDKGLQVFQQSNEREEINFKDLKLDGIPDVEHATLKIMIYGENRDHATWIGKASGLKFTKGKTTTVDIVLYPTSAAQKSEVSMPTDLNVPRFGHSATLLNDNRILVAGGFSACFTNVCKADKSVEIIDLESGEVTRLKDMNEERALHTVIPLSDGSVLFLGGVKTFVTSGQEEAFENYPLLPYVMEDAVMTIERYMPPYPKHNQSLNGFIEDTMNSNGEVETEAEIPFKPFQSIITKKINVSESDTETASKTLVILAGGVSSKGNPSKKSYKFTITEKNDKTVSIGTVKELAESEEPMLLPVLEYQNSTLFAAGGRPLNTEAAASIITENGSQNAGKPEHNIFFAQGVLADDKLYTFGGHEIDSKTGTFITSAKKTTETGEEVNETRLNAIRLWTLSDGTARTVKERIVSYGKNVAFPAVVKDSKNFIIVGGTSAANYFQRFNIKSPKLIDNPPQKMGDKRIMPGAVVVPAGVISEDDKQMIVITGGISSLDGNGTAVSSIKIKNL